MFAYHGQYLRVDVSTGRAESVPLDEQVLRQFIGGVGLGAYLLHVERAASVDPLDPASPLCFVFSPWVGSPLTTSAKFAVVGRSPLTGRFNDSLASSQFALSGKRTGFDAIVIVGRATNWSLLVIDEDRVRLEPADVWLGLTCPETECSVRERLGSDYSSAVIGPAGERLVRYATISHDGRHAGRGGHGAVLGSKRIKALAVRGDRRAVWAQPEALIHAAKDLSARSFGPATAKYRELGTAANLLLFNRLAALPTRNFQQGSFAGAAEIAPEQLAVAREKSRKSCAACTIGCEHLYSLGDSSSGTTQVRVEYENLFALGSLCAIDDPQLVLTASARCDALGIDTISAGGTIALAMECVERGWLDWPWLRFGDGSAMLRALDEIGAGSDVGQRLGQGSRRLAEEIGPDALRIAPQVKGLELPGYEPRSLQTMALGFAVGARGADHNRSGAYEVDFAPETDRLAPDASAVLRAIEVENRAALIDSLILCKFLRGVFDDPLQEWSRLLNLATGWDTTADELRQTAERIITSKKMFNVDCGWTPEEDWLPERFLSERLPEESRAVIDPSRLRAMIECYNLARGWTAAGYVPPEIVDWRR